MKTTSVPLAIVIWLFLTAMNAAAQVGYHDVYSWQVETRWGRFEFREIESDDLTWRRRFVTLGSFGTFQLNTTEVVVAAIVTPVFVTAVFVVPVAIWRGRRSRMNGLDKVLADAVEAQRPRLTTS